jgi:hypothetical protein
MVWGERGVFTLGQIVSLFDNFLFHYIYGEVSN